MKFFVITLLIVVLAACSPPAEPLPTVAPTVEETEDDSPAAIPTTAEEPETIEPTPTRESADLPDENTEAVAGNAQSVAVEGGTSFTLPVGGEAIILVIPEGWSQDSDRLVNDADPLQRFTITVLSFSSFDGLSLEDVAAQMLDNPVVEMRTVTGRDMAIAMNNSEFEAIYVRDSDGDLLSLEVPDIVTDPAAILETVVAVAATIEAE